MKKHPHILLICIICLLPMIAFSQEKESKFQYSFGGGITTDNNNLLWGLNLGTELNYRFAKRFSLNTGLSFYQSLGNLEKNELSDIDQSSGIFISPTLRYDIIQRDSGFKLAFGAGPSLQLGGESVRVRSFFNPDDPVPFTIINKYQRVGLLLELEAAWKSKNPNIRNAVGVSAYGADYYFPWFINATYKVRFQLGKK
ncbi:hypothetical protein SAMN06295967_10784 [Belliella buryatensis]|uniref:Outer membrane protein beta-barrel domain-containing protein n=1 Tax=Belliella buryatensis TaxID=1500549 RepID=A0A239DK34_9BACT|nr:hypothetical protein [Belliella buryatensis]SNS32381.1 hypothetical protein SAMN06295967_10784 [Belliella buryatensis]